MRHFQVEIMWGKSVEIPLANSDLLPSHPSTVKQLYSVALRWQGRISQLFLWQFLQSCGQYFTLKDIFSQFALFCQGCYPGVLDFRMKLMQRNRHAKVTFTLEMFGFDFQLRNHDDFEDFTVINHIPCFNFDHRH